MIDPHTLRTEALPRIEHRYGQRDCILYALGLSIGFDPLDEADLHYVDETRLQVQPTMANVLGYPGFWMRDPRFGIAWLKTVHGEHALRIHKPLPVEAHVVGSSRIVGLVDKGAGKGALIYVQREITDASSGERLATVQQTVFCRGDGGFGTGFGEDQATLPPRDMPACPPDVVVDLPTSPQSALIYRLSGDTNPLHADPATARAAGFDRPILHGLATFGVVGRGLVKTVCAGEPTRLRALGGRFSAPVFPGETARLEVWDGGAKAHGQVSFRASVPARQAVVMNNGFAEVDG